MKNLLRLCFALSVLVYIGCDTSKQATNETTSAKTTQTMEKSKEMVKQKEMAKQQEMSKAKMEAKAETMKNEMKKMTAAGEMATGGKIGFAAANDRYSADGEFKKWNFTEVNMENDDITTLKASLDVDLSSIWEKSPKLTDHLKAPDFFNIAKYTTAKIDIANIKEQPDGTYTADMKLDMKALSQEMTSTFMVTSKDPLHVKGTAMVNRSLFGLGGEIGTGDMIEVTYDTDIPN